MLPQASANRNPQAQNPIVLVMVCLDKFETLLEINGGVIARKMALREWMH
jgi:hypothetical protein